MFWTQVAKLHNVQLIFVTNAGLFGEFLGCVKTSGTYQVCLISSPLYMGTRERIRDPTIDLRYHSLTKLQ
uniref:Uncharacterized protein n=1 Tax=Anguilla anguilla TaxID=7936 RepID=A0A0E9V463_ANGAN